MTKRSSMVHAHSLDAFCHTLEGSNSNLRVYRDNGKNTLTHSLSNNFPLLRTYIGEPSFSTLARAYRDWSVDNDSNLNTYGEYLPFFIAEQRHSSKQLHYAWDSLADLAHLELAIIQLYYGRTTRLTLSMQHALTRSFGPSILTSLDMHHPYVIHHHNAGTTKHLMIELRGVKIWLCAEKEFEQ